MTGFETVTTKERFEELANEGWDELVGAMRSPSPFFLHAWLGEWWRELADGRELRVHTANRDGRLVAAVPLARRGRVLEFMAGEDAPLGDVLLREGEDGSVAAELVERAAGAGGYAFADLFGARHRTRLLESPAARRLRLVERVEAPVLDLSAGWEAVYRAKTSSKKRNLHGRRRRQLAELGRVEVSVARSAEELEAALVDAFRIHELRWHGRPDSSRFATPSGRRFNLAAFRALAPLGVPRIVTLSLDGRAIAFHAFLAFHRTMFVYRLGFDPALARHSPGLVNTLDTLEAAAAEGITRVEFLGGAERYKVELADGVEPLYEAIGLARGPTGHVRAAARLAGIRLRRRLKSSPTVMRLLGRAQQSSARS